MPHTGMVYDKIATTTPSPHYIVVFISHEVGSSCLLSTMVAAPSVLALLGRLSDRELCVKIYSTNFIVIAGDLSFFVEGNI